VSTWGGDMVPTTATVGGCRAAEMGNDCHWGAETLGIKKMVS